MNEEKEEAIRRRAYALWEKAGRPEGDHHSHWEQASREFEAVAQGGNQQAGQDTGQDAGQGAPTGSDPADSKTPEEALRQGYTHNAP